MQVRVSAITLEGKSTKVKVPWKEYKESMPESTDSVSSEVWLLFVRGDKFFMISIWFKISVTSCSSDPRCSFINFSKTSSSTILLEDAWRPGFKIDCSEFKDGVWFGVFFNLVCWSVKSSGCVLSQWSRMVFRELRWLFFKFALISAFELNSLYLSIRHVSKDVDLVNER